MKHHVYRQFGNYNAAGVVINEGYYALLGAIMGLSVEKALQRICRFSHYTEHTKEKIKSYKKVLVNADEMRKVMNRKGYSYRYMSELVGCSTTVIYRANKGKPTKMLWVSEIEKVLNLPTGSLIKGDKK